MSYILFYPELESQQSKPTWGNCQTNEPGEPTASYRWTGGVWEITGWSSRLQENYGFVLEEYMEYTSNQ